jgi:hypothetical protein
LEFIKVNHYKLGDTMTKYMVLYNSSLSAWEQMAKATPEEMKASMDEWIRWQDEASKTAKLDWGLPLQAVGHVTADRIQDSVSHISGYSMAEGESKEAILELFKTHPHLKWPDASIEVLEMLPIPEMQGSTSR